MALRVTTIPSASRGLDGVYHPGSRKRSLLAIYIDDIPMKAATGHRIIMKTVNAEKLPLPSIELLDMQFALHNGQLARGRQSLRSGR